jgi:hypothetical protein
MFHHIDQVNIHTLGKIFVLMVYQECKHVPLTNHIAKKPIINFKFININNP